MSIVCSYAPTPHLTLEARQRHGASRRLDARSARSRSCSASSTSKPSSAHGGCRMRLASPLHAAALSTTKAHVANATPLGRLNILHASPVMKVVPLPRLGSPCGAGKLELPVLERPSQRVLSSRSVVADNTPRCALAPSASSQRPSSCSNNGGTKKKVRFAPDCKAPPPGTMLQALALGRGTSNEAPGSIVTRRVRPPTPPRLLAALAEPARGADDSSSDEAA
eukprot:TRINITY_DN91673_c0_g1_i1.p2 TRINITY_DN91673_c0_g1~~TRINITY_DN91673_c0_g1_i1.p2  ORF type:complete len:223 (+),score=14.61 TRINITY_DN91673_c0_g1_i1:97-765(+)